MSLGISGALTKRFIRSPLTPLFLIAAVVCGLIALTTIPREEDPQIHVPMVDVIVNTDGLKASDAVELVTKPLEVVLRAIPGVEHIYSTTVDNHVTVTARFVVGTNEDKAVLLVNDKIRANMNRIPIGIPEPMVVGHGIDDVAIITLTLSPKPDAANRWDYAGLTDLAQKLQGEMIKIPNVGLTYISGEDPEQIRIEPDPEKLALYGVTLQQLVARVQEANDVFSAGVVRENGQMPGVDVGHTLDGVPDIGLLLVTTRDDRPVYVRDVAKVVFGPAPQEERVWALTRDKSGWGQAPAVTLAIAKVSGSNAVNVAKAVLAQVKTLQGQLIPGDIRVQVTRDYGQTATQKANELLFHLALATISIILLIGFALGWREAAVTAVVIPSTILLTLFGAEMMGYTINRVSLFALIFAIGILVDDAIVVIENITRHWAMHDGRSRIQAAIEAVSEVGNPTIVATLTVITALLPMLFVSGLMGPYMSPIPAVASVAMVFSFFVAMIIAPWLMLKVSGNAPAAAHAEHADSHLTRLYIRIARPILQTRKRALRFLLIVGGATIVACSLFYFDLVKVKLLPFDNKSELDVVLNLPPGAALEDTERTLFAAARIAGQMKEVTSMQVYAGTAAPYDFNGLVRHYYARQSPELGELHIVLVNKDDRSRQSHAIAVALRQQLDKNIPLPPGGVIKVVEVPPGPPVISSLLAEIYGPTPEMRLAEAQRVKKIFESIPYIVDVDDSYGLPPPRLQISVDQDELEYFHVQQADVNQTLRDLFLGEGIGYSYRGADRPPLEIAIGLPKSGLTWDDAVASTPVPANTLPGSRGVVELGQVVSAQMVQGSRAIYRRDGHFADMVTAEMAGQFEAPIYGMFAVDSAIEKSAWTGLPKPEIRFFSQPRDEAKPSLLWDGEWQITYVTFRDMGMAFGVAILGIYVLVVAQFGSFKLPLVVLTPIPLTLIGIMLGHWLLGADFTATSMIGFIALAGIIVRNSILLVDFIRHRQASHRPLRDVLLEAGAIRAKPILLTALAAMISAATILSDPIFQGLATSLLFGLASSTLLTLLVIPAIYVVLRDDNRPAS
ncbi:efflux RND transporter permease subunit [Acidocella sp. KAb 2-4]|uniref:efflux RND transporter permease subunit n=1 Tax=Acidocella sp. KAb 2-4 TaxID=2885158 RepID=UPI001D07E4B4|nr:efflux RND transporter permease subunit [Acidocella sp. KAb 2-4]MCB5944037.1 efflux RND transporter permease subunit [Acidocella sp. KAb 2-4]